MFTFQLHFRIIVLSFSRLRDARFFPSRFLSRDPLIAQACQQYFVLSSICGGVVFQQSRALLLLFEFFCGVLVQEMHRVPRLNRRQRRAMTRVSTAIVVTNGQQSLTALIVEVGLKTSDTHKRSAAARATSTDWNPSGEAKCFGRYKVAIGAEGTLGR
jgi:hypothetical protein